MDHTDHGSLYPAVLSLVGRPDGTFLYRIDLAGVARTFPSYDEAHRFALNLLKSLAGKLPC